MAQEYVVDNPSLLVADRQTQQSTFYNVGSRIGQQQSRGFFSWVIFVLKRDGGAGEASRIVATVLGNVTRGDQSIKTDVARAAIQEVSIPNLIRPSFSGSNVMLDYSRAGQIPSTSSSVSAGTSASESADHDPTIQSPGEINNSTSNQAAANGANAGRSDTYAIVRVPVNPTTMQTTRKPKITPSTTRGGFYWAYWGEEAAELVIQGTTGNSGIVGINMLQQVYEHQTKRLGEKNANENLWSNGQIEMIYKGQRHLGHFTGFSIEERADKPGYWTYNMRMTVISRSGNRSAF